MATGVGNAFSEGGGKSRETKRFILEPGSPVLGVTIMAVKAPDRASPYGTAAGYVPGYFTFGLPGDPEI